MLCTTRIARPWALFSTRATHSAASPAPPPPPRPLRPRPPPVPTDDLCIPLIAPYSLSDYLPAPGQSPSLDRPTLVKLHRLAALEPPAPDDDHGWAALRDLDELVAIVQAVRDVDTSALGLAPGAMVDARVRAEPQPVDWSSSSSSAAAAAAGGQEGVEEPPAARGQALLDLASRTEGAYYVAPMPDNKTTVDSISTFRILSLAGRCAGDIAMNLETTATTDDDAKSFG
ncbi:hypothetical protein JCM8208_004339 [Rhodotorula glutinis]